MVNISYLQTFQIIYSL